MREWLVLLWWYPTYFVHGKIHSIIITLNSPLNKSPTTEAIVLAHHVFQKAGKWIKCVPFEYRQESNLRLRETHLHNSEQIQTEKQKDNKKEKER